MGPGSAVTRTVASALDSRTGVARTVSGFPIASPVDERAGGRVAGSGLAPSPPRRGAAVAGRHAVNGPTGTPTAAVAPARHATASRHRGSGALRGLDLAPARRAGLNPRRRALIKDTAHMGRHLNQKHTITGDPKVRTGCQRRALTAGRTRAVGLSLGASLLGVAGQALATLAAPTSPTGRALAASRVGAGSCDPPGGPTGASAAFEGRANAAAAWCGLHACAGRRTSGLGAQPHTLARPVPSTRSAASRLGARALASRASAL